MLSFSTRTLIVKVSGAVDQDTKQFLAYDTGLRFARIAGILFASIFDESNALRRRAASTFGKIFMAGVEYFHRSLTEYVKFPANLPMPATLNVSARISSLSMARKLFWLYRGKFDQLRA